ncbi:MAG: hypothetical protein LBN26_03775, partial [Christensenellaceae bacterium]|nr:hypothetical protein [Christensenellaceae bacterium]
MKRLILTLLAAAMVFSLAACGIVNPGGNEPSVPADGWAAEYTILIGGSDEWTPFAGKSGVIFANSDDKVIDVSDDGTTVEFTGKKVGESVITATFDGTESKAIVRVRATETSGEDLLKWKRPESLYVKYIGDPYSLTPDVPDVKYYTGYGKEIEIISHSSEFGQYYHDNPLYISFFGPSSSNSFSCNDNGDWYWGDPYDFKWERADNAYYSLYWGDERGSESSEHGPGGSLFFPLNAFARALPPGAVLFGGSIAEFRTSKHETILGVNCDVFEIEGNTFYVDPKNHYTLKV